MLNCVARSHKCETRDEEDTRTPLMHHFSEDILDIEVDEIRAALGQLKNESALGYDGVTTKLLKTTRRPVLKALVRLFNTVHGVSGLRSRSAVVLFFKNGDNYLFKNYRSVPILSQSVRCFRGSLRIPTTGEGWVSKWLQCRRPHPYFSADYTKD